MSFFGVLVQKAPKSLGQLFQEQCRDHPIQNVTKWLKKKASYKSKVQTQWGKGSTMKNVTEKEVTWSVMIFCKTLPFELQEKLYLKIFCVYLAYGQTSNQPIIKTDLWYNRGKIEKVASKFLLFLALVYWP